MSWELMPFSVPLALLGVALLGSTVALVRFGGIDDVGARLAVALLAGTGFWVTLYALQVSQFDLAISVFLQKLQVGILSVLAPLWLAYVCRYSGYGNRVTWRTFGPVLAIGTVIVFASATNEAHWLFWTSVSMTEAPLGTLDTDPGPLFSVFLLYLFGLIGVATVLLAATGLQTRGVLRGQVAALLVISLAPPIAGAFYVAGGSPIAGLNPAPVATVVTAVGAVVGAIRFRWLELTPITRASVVDAMSAAMIVVSEGETILDHNTRAAELLAGARGVQLVGRPLADVQPRLADVLEESDGGTVSLSHHEERFDTTVTPIDDGWVVVLHDITDRISAETEIRERKAATERLADQARRLAAGTTREELHARAVDGAVDIVRADHCRFLSIEGWDTVASTGPLPELSDLVSTAIAKQVVETGESHVVDDLSIRGVSIGVSQPSGNDLSVSTPESSPTLGVRSTGPDGTDADGSTALEEEFDSLVTVPIDGVGVLQVFAADRGAFTPEDARMLSLFGSHVSTVADRIATESELREERDRLEEFASVVSHDLRNPLSVASGFLELAREDPSPEHFDRIERAHERMDQLVDDLLTLARHGDVVGEMTDVDLASTVSEAWASVDTGSNLSLSNESDDLGRVRADERRLHDLLANLFRNVDEHAPPGPETPVTVRVGRDDDTVYVADDGRGIPEDVRDSLFDRGVTTSESGTGYGLAIVAEIAEAHGWEIDVGESDTGGARFELRGIGADAAADTDADD